MGSSNQDPGVSLRTDGWLQKPVDSLMQIPDKIQNSLKLHLGRFLGTGGGGGVNAQMSSEKVRGLCSAAADVRLEKQLQAWRNDPSWTDHPPEIKVTVPQGSLCNLNLRFEAGLPPDAVYNIIIDPENKRVFKNIKVKFKQGRSGFMKKFEGCWKIEPLFVDKEACLPLDPNTLEEYDSCTAGRGRVGSAITLDQLIEPAILPPQPIAWYVRGITAKTTEMLVNDLIAETARVRGVASNVDNKHYTEENCDISNDLLTDECGDIKERWRQRRKSGRHGNSLRSARQEV